MSKGEMTRQRIVELAAPIFNQRGYTGCSMQQIMEATGLEKGGIYRHFASKEELAVEAFRYSIQRVMEARSGAIDRTLSPLEMLRQYIALFVAKPSPVPGGCPIMNTAIDADDGNSALRNQVRESLKNWRGRVEEVAEQAIQRRQIRKSVPPRQVATTIIATLEGALMMSRLEGTRAPLEDARASLDLFLESIACPSKH